MRGARALIGVAQAVAQYAPLGRAIGQVGGELDVLKCAIAVVRRGLHFFQALTRGQTPHRGLVQYRTSGQADERKKDDEAV